MKLHSVVTPMNKVCPEVSIIIVNYNGLNYLHDCFSSLMEIDYPKELLEYIMVDNGSTDGSVKYMERRFPDVQILRNTSNRGYAGANNQAAKAANGKILAFLNNDMKVHSLWLKTLIHKFIESSDDLVCVSSKILNYEGNKIDFIGGGFTPFGISFQVDFGKPVGEIDNQTENRERELLFGCGGSMAIKKNVFIECGGFDEDYFAYLEDVDLGWRLRIMGYRILYVPESIAFHKQRGTGKKIPLHQLEFMFERNRIFTIIKNTEDTYLPYFLSMVCMSNINRTYLSSMDNILDYYFSPLNQVRRPGQIKDGMNTQLSVLRKLRMMLETRDLGLFWRWIIRKNIRLISALTGTKFVPPRTLSFSAAFTSIIPELDSLLLKRKEIQSKRKISDAQIFPLFLADRYAKQAIANDYMLGIEKIMSFERNIMKENQIDFPE